MKTYKLTGFVYGYLWGGGLAAYPATKIENKNRKALIKEAEKMLASGSLDSGMGYQSLKGALLEIEEIETVTKNGKDYSRNDFEEEIIGKLTDEEVEFLEECQLNA